MKGQLRVFLLRRKFIVDREFQFDLLFRAFCYCVVALLAVAVGVFYPMIREIRSGIDPTGAVNAMLYLHKSFWPIAITGTVLALLIALQISHRIAGPLYQLKRGLGDLLRGVMPGHLRTRRKDYLQREVALFNEVVDSLESRMERTRQAEREFAADLEHCRSVMDTDGVGSREALARLEKSAGLLRDSALLTQPDAEVAQESAREQEPEPQEVLLGPRG